MSDPLAEADGIVRDRWPVLDISAADLRALLALVAGPRAVGAEEVEATLPSGLHVRVDLTNNPMEGEWEEDA